MARAAFLDEAVLEVHGGRGGNGIASFLRTRRQPKGGPDGGNGGDGGGVYAQATYSLSSLADYVMTLRRVGGKGSHGGNKKKHGARGSDLWLNLPVGTDIHDVVTGNLHATLLEEGDSVALARGGEGGRGNVTFKSSINRTPYEATPGLNGEERSYRLSLRLLADVGLLGLPNAGKSSFINCVSNASSAIGDYPFTTLRPHLGVVAMEDFSQLTIADIPGIIRGASQGAGLGLRFLRHVTRTKVLLHMVDCCTAEAATVLQHIEVVMDELRQAGITKLLDQHHLLVLTKIDLLDDAQVAKLMQVIRQNHPDKKVSCISAHSGFGVKQLLREAAKLSLQTKGVGNAT